VQTEHQVKKNTCITRRHQHPNHHSETGAAGCRNMFSPINHNSDVATLAGRAVAIGYLSIVLFHPAHFRVHPVVA
jgi:hypothetical protein